MYSQKHRYRCNSTTDRNPIKMKPSPNTLWEECLKQIRVHLPEKQFSTWFSTIQLHSYVEKENCVILQVPSEMARDYIEEHYMRLLANALRDNFGSSVKLKYSISMAKLPHSANNQAGEQNDNDGLYSGNSDSYQENSKREAWRNYLDNHYTFDSFIRGESNAVALSVSLSIAEHPTRRQFNPMFLFGPSGCGKTHLINAIGLRIAKLYENKKVLYVSAKDFEVQYTSAQYTNKINDFMHFYQNIDVLIVDDIQSWAGKKKTLETFFYIFNHLFRNGKRIILACDRPPAELEGMEERLLTRFVWGVVEELGKPNIQLCIDILKSKVKRDGLSIPDDVIRYIAERANGSIRYLEGVINTLYAFSINLGREIDIAFADERIKKLVKIDDKAISTEEIIDAVCKQFDVSSTAIGSRSRKHDFVVARQVAMYLAQKYTNMSISRIGRLVGGRDHATVIHSCNQVEKRLKTDKDFASSVKTLEQIFDKKQGK